MTVIDRHGWSMFQRSLKLMTRDTMSTWRQEGGGGGDETLENAGEENGDRTPRAFFFPRLSLPVCSALYSILRIRRNGKKNRDINRPFHPNDQSSINNLRTRTFDPGLIPNTTRTTWIDLSIARAISLCHRSFRILNTRATVQ